MLMEQKALLFSQDCINATNRNKLTKINDIEQSSHSLLLQQNAVQYYVAAGLRSQYYRLYFSHSPGSGTLLQQMFYPAACAMLCFLKSFNVNTSFHFLVNLKGNLSIILTF